MLIRKGLGLEMNVEETKHILISRHQNVDQNHYINIANTGRLEICHN
jgi:hypothetical protein